MNTQNAHAVIENRQGEVPWIDGGEVWRYRELLYFLVWRDLKVRYKQTLLGVVWVLLQPIATIAIFTVTFSRWAKVPSDGYPYPLFAFLGILAWNFFASGARNSVNSITSSAALISKVYFPRILCPCAAVAATFADFLIALLVMVPMAIHYHIAWSFSGAIIFALLTFGVGLFAIGFGLWLGPINARFRDVAQLLPFAFQIWMYATPVIYPMTIVPGEYRKYLVMNPMVGYIEGFRSAILGKALNLEALGWSVGWTLFLVVTGLFFFQRHEPDIADYLG